MVDKMSYRLLKRLYREGRMTDTDVRKITGYTDESITDACTSLLYKEGFIQWWHSEQVDKNGCVNLIGCEITHLGRAYVEDKRKSFWGFFLPYAITTLIALLSLFTSIASNWDKVQAFLESVRNLCTQCP